jgi:ferredoxin
MACCQGKAACNVHNQAVFRETDPVKKAFVFENGKKRGY